DGDTALIGGGGGDAGAGGAWGFQRSAGAGGQSGPELTGAGPAPGGPLGQSGALSPPRAIAPVAARRAAHRTGAARVLGRPGATWTPAAARLTARDEDGQGFFGKSVALSAGGDMALIGGYGDEDGLGAAWVFASWPAATGG